MGLHVHYTMFACMAADPIFIIICNEGHRLYGRVHDYVYAHTVMFKFIR